ncbi:vesicle-trafficking protein SEC22a-like [Ptychodera flava]|uniref:vesicle-trafficking protein SEC22a-like n=1 Tax=Ptychodera flava TaxID=63121 RepID=UPI00396A0505
MVLCAIITRVSDGLALTASTDLDLNKELKDSRLYVKALSKKVATLPDRCSIHLGNLWLHFIASLGVCFMVLCEDRYPTVLAFCFLDEIQREFIVSYDRKKIDSVVRPYAFIEFDNFMQKARQKYLNTGSLTTKVNLSDMTTEIKLRPPHRLTLAELGISNANGIETTSNRYRPKPLSQHSLSPMNWLAFLSFLLNILCGLLNLGRAVIITLYGEISLDDTPESPVKYIMVFFLAAVLCSYQSYLQVVFTKRKTLKGLAACAALIYCNAYLTTHRYRYIEAFIFNCVVSIFAVWQIRTRGMLQKAPDYNV